MTECRRPMPFLDLKAQQARIAADLRRRLDAVLAHCQFILGPEVAELEARAGARSAARSIASAVSSGTDALQIAHDGRGDRPRRRGVPARLHLHRHRRGAAGAGRHAGVRRCRSAHLPDRSRASCGAHRRGARAPGKLRPRAIIGVDLFGQPADWPALRAIAAREGLFTLDDLRAELRRVAAWAQRLGDAGRRDGDQLLPLQAAGRLRRRRRAVHRKRRARRRCIAACAPTARARPATRCCAPA